MHWTSGAANPTVALMNRYTSLRLLAALVFGTVALQPQAQTAQPGEVRGSAYRHTVASAEGAIQGAFLVLPANVTGGAVFAGAYRDAPAPAGARVPVVIFMHGSSGLGLKAIGEWQQWLATLGIASIAPDSFSLPNRLTYVSPVAQDVYEKIHALRASEVGLALQALRTAPWADMSRVVLAGTSEGATAVARHGGNEFAGRIIYSWSCEDNYFVGHHETALPADLPVLNVISLSDPYFAPSNPWLGNPAAKGYCADALRANTKASIVLVPGAPHTLINLPPARHAAEGFLRDLFHI